MNYTPQHLGLTITDTDISPRRAVSAGVTEGIADIARYLTLGLAAIMIYKLIPRKQIKRLQKEARRFQ